MDVSEEKWLSVYLEGSRKQKAQDVITQKDDLIV